jgi:urease accessory protein
MNSNSVKNLGRFVLLISTLGATASAFAHVDPSHVATGFTSGFAHPFSGLDHLLAMLAVGLWASQHKGASRWMLPAVFPAAMMIGALVGFSGVQLAGVESGIAVSVAVLGLLIAFAVKLPKLASGGLVALFALIHGYAHGVEMPIEHSALQYGMGFVLATALIHAMGLSVGLAARKDVWSHITRFAGAGIAAVGVYLIAM